jgi:hypothetical protein
MVNPQSAWLLALSVFIFGLLTVVSAAPLAAQSPGCQAELRGERGSRLTVQVFDHDLSGARIPVTDFETTVGVRSGHILRISVRPNDGTARPDGPACPVRVSLGRLIPVARLLSSEGFLMDRNTAYALMRPDETRTIELQMKPFPEWNSVNREIQIENVTLEVPEAAEFVAKLPPPYAPPPGTVCAEVVYPDAQSATGIPVRLTAPPEAEPMERHTDDAGRACWDGFDELLFGHLSLHPDIDTALDQPDERYVSRQASYRLFVVKRPR